jgi:hypothetical protein
MKKALVILALFMSYVILSCDIMMSEKERAQSKKMEMASDLYNRIGSLVYSTRNGSFTPEWQNIEKRILDNQDTIFFIENTDFKIMVTLRHNLVFDSMKTIQDSIDQKEQQKTERKSW